MLVLACSPRIPVTYTTRGATVPHKLYTRKLPHLPLVLVDVVRKADLVDLVADNLVHPSGNVRYELLRDFSLRRLGPSQRCCWVRSRDGRKGTGRDR